MSTEWVHCASFCVARSMISWASNRIEKITKSRFLKDLIKDQPLGDATDWPKAKDQTPTKTVSAQLKYVNKNAATFEWTHRNPSTGSISQVWSTARNDLRRSSRRQSDRHGNHVECWMFNVQWILKPFSFRYRVVNSKLTPKRLISCLF